MVNCKQKNVAKVRLTTHLFDFWLQNLNPLPILVAESSDFAPKTARIYSHLKNRCLRVKSYENDEMANQMFSGMVSVGDVRD